MTYDNLMHWCNLNCREENESAHCKISNWMRCIIYTIGHNGTNGLWKYDISHNVCLQDENCKWFRICGVFYVSAHSLIWVDTQVSLFESEELEETHQKWKGCGRASADEAENMSRFYLFCAPIAEKYVSIIVLSQ